ncbi:MAG: DNA recombination protein RmuC [Bacteroides sp.]|nr:DNA recombination protein RmuC [Roseburia sp.]MCM1347540.1 DNA recombination protein RmuC [Bacteroides sp.]MCM1421985.1 DNA recombination protein RmuC [Bacteroides sp.]
MGIVLYIIVAAATGTVIGYVMRNKEAGKLAGEADFLRKDNSKKDTELADLKNKLNAMQAQIAGYVGRIATAEADKNAAEKALVQEKSNNEQHIKLIKKNYDDALESMKSQFYELAVKTLNEHSEELKRSNLEQIAGIVTPVKEEMDRVKKAVQDVGTSNAAQKASVEKAIEGLAAQTQRMDQKATELTNALKDKGKVQGDWGEQLLESILEESGLRRGHEYETQSNIKDEEGKNLRPDVIVRCPGGKNIIIDSKVSLTAYLNYTGAQSEEESRRYEKDNLASVRRHIDELAAKKYEKYVQNTISHVLMFIPNEGSYILSLRTDPQLGQYAFKKGILLINPTNLMMSLQLIYNLWQSEKQSRNIEAIIKQSSELYDKFVTFVETFMKVDEALKTAQRNCDTAFGQLSNGRGNIVRRLEGLKQLGITPKKSIPGKLTEENAPETETGVLPGE